MGEEGKRELLGLADPGQALAQGGGGFGEVRRAAIGEFLALDIAPQQLDRVEVGRVAGQPFLAQPSALAREVGLHDPALVGGQAVPHQDDSPASEVASQLFQEGDQAFGAVAARPDLEIQTAALPVPAVSQGRRHRDFSPVEGVDQPRRLAARRPGAADRGPLGDTALVLEEDPGLAAPSVFLPPASAPEPTGAPRLHSVRALAGRAAANSSSWPPGSSTRGRDGTAPRCAAR